VTEYFENNHWDLWQAYCYTVKVCLKLLVKIYKNPINENKAENSDNKLDSETQKIFDLAHPFQTYMRYHWIIYISFYEVRIVNEEREINPILTCLLKTFFRSLKKSNI